MMGVVERLYKMLLEECVGLDVGEGNKDDYNDERMEMREQLRDADEEISDAKSLLKDYGSDIIDNMNRKSRHEAVLAGKREENENLA